MESMTSHGAWYAVQTKRHKEAAAQLQISSDAVPTYLPRVCVWPRPAVGSEIAAMFPGYLFAYLCLPRDYYRVVWKPGVRAIVSFGGEPTPLPDEAVEFLRSREDERGLIRCGAEHDCSIRILRGPLKGLSAVLDSRIDGKGRVVVLMDLLRSRTRVELPDTWVVVA